MGTDFPYVVTSFLEEKKKNLVKVHHFCEEKERKKKRKKADGQRFLGWEIFAKMQKKIKKRKFLLQYFFFLEKVEN